MKILSGEFRGRQIRSPKGDKTRPTTSQVRACVFNICQHSIFEARFLDICAGSGAMGFEALSRGAKEVTFIDKDREAVSIIRENAKLLGVEAKCRLLCQEASVALIALEKLSLAFDICYFDPPYGSQNGSQSSALLSFLDTSLILAPSALLFTEESIKSAVNTNALSHLILESKRRLGDTSLYCFKRAS